ncbi:flagellar hook-basal body complex protein FliE [Thiogranum longum]|uniref:Flagellar hook-basal body complex protein FliE n=1 Tax=Thiogranum longum TaxID=1537524 RepID=A0A4R1HA91_9GAMM|nr:flagellar hook-basal body complex protein FliE [Thiogranum longum]TCK18847.1 flagellar hook-basal body complex protein FliE [Thiogranum longum]
MSTISNVDQVLAEMRRLTAAAQSTPAELGQTQSASGENFASLLKQSVDEVNNIQQTAGKLSSAFSAGDPNVDVTEVMVALQKAGVAFQAMTEVRNRLVSAYQEIMSMQV